MGISVLLVDDSETIRKCVINCLVEETDIKIVGEASGCVEAIKLMEALKPQIVLMDMHLPDSTVTRNAQLVSLLSLHFAQLIAISVYVDDETTQMACNLGAIRLLDKMNLFSELAPAIREVAVLPLGIAS
jgi:DNA-binding NarL/FixJ family response regulator